MKSKKIVRLSLYGILVFVLALAVYTFAGQKMSFQEALQKKESKQNKTQSKILSPEEKFHIQEKLDQQKIINEVDRNIAHIQKGLKDNSLYPAHMADPSIYNLGRAKSQKAVPILIIVLENYYLPDARRDAARALGEIGNKQAIPSLIKSLKDKDFQVKLAIAESLVKLGKHSVAFPILKKIALKENIKNWNIDVSNSYASLTFLSEEEKNKRRSQLITEIKFHSLPSKAIKCLGDIADDSSINIIHKTLKDKNEFVRLSAANELINTQKKKDAIHTLDQIISDRSITNTIRSAALSTLARGIDKTEYHILNKYKQSDNEYISKKTIKLINKMKGN